MKKKPKPPPEPRDDPSIEDIDLVLGIVAAACEFRDCDGESDPSRCLEAIDNAVDRWRMRLITKTGSP